MKLIGVNLSGVYDYADTKPFADTFKSHRGWGTVEKPHSGQGTIPLDNLGNPLTDCGVCVFTDQRNVHGTYKFSCKGKTKVTLSSTRGRVQNLAFDEASNTTTADVVLDEGAPQLMMRFTETNGGIKDAKLMRPGHTEADLFSHDLLKALKLTRAVRLMGWAATNGSTAGDWSKRTLPHENQGTANGYRGVCVEYQCELANQADIDLWMCIPHLADENYIRECLKVCKEKLSPERRLYLEYSNEVWNWQFKQAKWNLDEAKKPEVKAAMRLNYDGNTNDGYHAWRRVGYMAATIAKIAIEVFGRAAINDRVRVIAAAQISYGNGEQFKEILKYVKAVHGEPKDLFFATAGAPYFSIPEALQVKADVTSDEIVNALAEAAATWGTKTRLVREIATSYGIKHVCYEGGVDMGQKDVAVDVKTASQLDPRMKDVIKTYLTNVYRDSDGMMYLTLAASSSKWGYWGLTEDISDLTQPKITGYREWVEMNGGEPEPPPAKPQPPTPPTGDIESRVKYLEDQWTAFRRLISEL